MQTNASLAGIEKGIDQSMHLFLSVTYALGYESVSAKSKPQESLRLSSKPTLLSLLGA